MRSSAMRLLFVFLAAIVTASVSAQTSDPFALTPPLVSQAITSCDDLTVSDGLIDSAATAGRANILSNGNIKVSGGKVDGDATAGPGKSVTRTGNGTITGSISSATTAFPCSLIDLSALSATLASTNDNATIPLSAQHKNPVNSGSDFTLSGGDSLTLQKGTYYFRKFTMSGGSTLTLAGPVRILTTSDVSLSGGSVAGANPWQLRFWSSGTKFTVSSTFVGFIYAPFATTKVSSAVVAGGIYGGAVTVSGNTSHVTRTLDDTPPAVTITSPTDGEAVVDLSHVTVHGTVTDPETAVVTFQVNGADVPLASDGSFTVTLNLSNATPATITATATNAAGLSSTSTVTVQSSVTQLTIAPPSLSIDQNGTGQLTATATFADGSTANVTSSATWSSTAPSIATVTAGLVTGVAPGTTTITATLGSFTASSTVTVNPLLQSIAVSPASASLAPAAKQSFTATGTYSDGTTKNITSNVSWTTSDSGIATIDTTGSATAVSPGTVVIRATVGSISGSATLTVLATPTIASLQPTRGRTVGGDTVTITGTNFGTVNNTTVTFGNATAVLTAASATSLTVTTPSHAAGIVDVAVTAPTGTVTSSAAFTYLAPPAIASIAPARGKTAGSNSVTVTGNNFDPGATTLTIGGASATNVVVASPTSLTATTPAGNAGAANVVVATAGGAATLSGGFTYVAAPVIASFTPAQGQAGTSVTINGTNFDAVAANDAVTIGGAPATVTSATTTRLIATVAANAVTGPITVTTAGGTATSSTNFIVSIYRSLTFTSSATTIQTGGHLQFSVMATKFDNTSLDVTSTSVWSTSDASVASVSASGLVAAGSTGATDITAAFSGIMATVHLSVAAPVSLPPAVIQGPPLDPTIVTPIADTIRFLYSGPNAIQTGVAANAISDNRAAVVSGRVLNATGAPLSGVQVTTAQHPELGQTVTRIDGRYDFVWNGGGPLHLVFAKGGYISSDRLVTTKWNQQKTIDDVVLLAYDGAVTTINAGAEIGQVAQGSPVTDGDGTRRATIYFPAGTAATLTNPDGTTAPASTLHVRATEFTVGTNGPKAMPALLPANSGYTYCVELSADEAPSITFSSPLSVYIENFINFPVGTPVPLGYFDRNQQKWLPMANGVVIKILTVSNGTVTIDSDGDGAADNAPGLSGDELAQLATLYTAGQTLWRVQVNHFTPFDTNWPFGPPSDAIPPQLAQPSAQPTVIAPSKCGGSIIDCENQRLGESILITGTPYSLDYDSGRTDRVQYQMTVPVTPASVPASLQSVTVQISVAGRTLIQQVAPSPNQTLTFTWDGLDAYNRPVEGARTADVSVTYTYPAQYRSPQAPIPAFDQPPAGTAVIGDRTRGTVSLQQATGITLGRVSSLGTGFGGWTFSAERAYDTIGRVLYDGTAQRGSDQARNGESSIYRAAGTGNYGVATSPGVATATAIGFPTSIAPRPEGGFYFVDNDAIYLVDANGNLSVVAGTPNWNESTPPSGDGTPAAGSLIAPRFMALAPDGAIYFSEVQRNLSDRIRRIVNGVLSTVGGGTSNSAPLGDGGAASVANFGGITGLTFAPDGVLYFCDSGHSRVRRISLNGIITTIAGGGASTADNIPALQASFSALEGIAVGPDGSVYFCAGLKVAKTTPDAVVHYITGGSGTALQDGDVASGKGINFPWGISVAGDGTVLFSERTGGHDRVWMINGGVAHVLGGAPAGNFAVTPSGALARAGQLSYLYDVKVGPDGNVFIADADQAVVERTGPTFPVLKSNTATIIPSEDGTIGYIFENGRHTRTVSTITGTTLETLAYDANGLLVSVTDVDQQATTIERDPAGNPSVIVAPGGQRTVLSVGAQGLASITNPASESYQFQYNSLGLLSQLTDPRSGIHTFTYDDGGRLTKDQDPAGGFLSLARAGTSSNYSITRTTAEGRASAVSWQQTSDLLTTRPTTGSDGLVTNTLENGDGSTTMATPTGAIVARTIASDSRFGMSAPSTATASIQMPSSLKLSLTASHQASLSNPADPLSVTSFTNALAINGRTFRSTFTKATQTLAFTTPAGRTRSTILNGHDRPVSMQVPGLAPVVLAYESHGLLASVAASSRQTLFTYDDHQRLKTITDPVHRIITFDYDGADRVTTETLPDQRQITYSYDSNGNVTSVTPPSRPVHSFLFTSVTLPDTYSPPMLPNTTGTATTYRYNNDRQITKVMRPDSLTLAFQYDSAGHLTTLTEPLGVHQYVYDTVKGTITSLSTPEGNGLGFTYDGELLKSVTWTGAVSASIGFSYDTSLRVATETVNGANSVVFTYDNDDLLLSAGSLSLHRDPTNSFLTGTTLGNLADTYTLNTFGEPTVYDVKLSGSSVFTLSYARDDAGRISQKIETVSGQTTTTSYSYDSVGRLTDVTIGASNIDYGYDQNGNRSSMTSAAGIISATYDGQDRLTTYAGASYFYSDGGELAKKIDVSGTTLYTYDVLGNLRSVTLPGGRVIDYVIDALNRRVGKKVNGTVVTGWIYSDNLRVIAETDGTGAVTKRFVYGYHRNVPDYMIWQGSAYRIVADHLGSPRYVLESTAGTVAQVLTYDEFGNVQNDSRPGFQPFGFGGGLYDPDTRLVRFGNRDYDPQTGRWTAKDPLLFDGGDVNVYAYVLDDPINLSDRAGLSSLIFTPSNDSVTVVNGAGQAVGTFPAANNAQSSSRGPWPEGTYRYAYHVDHPDDSVDSPFGSYGNFVFKVPGCTGCGVHSGRANKRDRRGRSGVHFATNGCVRTTDPATQFLSQLIAAGDPLSGLTVSDQPIPTNIPPIDSSLEGGPVVYPPDHP